MIFTAVSQQILSIPPFPAIKRRFSGRPVLIRFARGVYWTLVGNFTWRILTLISTIMVARILGREAFGEFGMLRSTIDFFSVFAGYRLGSIATKYIAEYSKKDPRKASAILKFSNISALALGSMILLATCLSSSWLATHTLNRPNLTLAIMIASVFLLVSTLAACSEGALSGFERFKSLSIVNFWKGIIPIILCAPAAYFWGVNGVMLAWVISTTCGLLISNIYLKQEKIKAGFPERIPLGELRDEMPILWNFVLPSIMEGIIIMGASWLARAYLARQPDGYAQMGLFSAAEQWRNLILFLPAVLGRVVLPFLSHSYGNQSYSSFENMLSLQIRVIWLIALPLTILVMGFAGPLSAIFGKQFHGSEEVIIILMISVFFFCANTTEKQALITTDHRWVNFFMMAGWGLVLLSASYYLVPSMGARGFALANLISYAALNFGLMLYTNLVIAPGVIIRHFGFYTYSLLLLGATFWARHSLDQTTAYPVMAFILFLALAPWRKLLKQA